MMLPINCYMFLSDTFGNTSLKIGTMLSSSSIVYLYTCKILYIIIGLV